jgi:hypothetical protein
MTEAKIQRLKARLAELNQSMTAARRAMLEALVLRRVSRLTKAVVKAQPEMARLKFRANLVLELPKVGRLAARQVRPLVAQLAVELEALRVDRQVQVRVRRVASLSTTAMMATLRTMEAPAVCSRSVIR